MYTLFVSDLHLSQERPDKLALFKNLLQGPARNADALYILGDLFEGWAGDDDTTPPHPEIISELSACTRSGVNLFFMRGNRDYLIGEKFTNETGVNLIVDPTVILLNGRKTLLMHGDMLCTRDILYQVYRIIVNNPFSISLFMAIPYSIRKKIRHGVRQMTRQTTRIKSPYITDVYQPAVDKIMTKYNVFELIHGHTHNQAVHEFKLHGQPARRLVLGDWYEKDCVLVARNNELKMQRVQELIDT